ncbi:MAG: hypothetical protein DCC67_03800 [Planctomycetota bacterium]|nr:MAG: hypothetical protein DCC67_03800 [Planctomycetota bacterium]
MSTESTAPKKKTRRLRSDSKSGAVRAYLKRKPHAGPTAISRALKKRGIDISPAHVSNVKTALKKAGLIEGGDAPAATNGRKRRGRGGKARGGDVVSLANLIEARQFVESVGGVEKANELISALAKLRD